MDFGTDVAGDPHGGSQLVRVGYARVSKREMNLALQVAELKRAGCTKIFTDKISALADDRPSRARAIAALKPGDQLVVWKLDRFARDLLDQLMGLRDIQLRGGSFVTLTEVIDTSDWMGRVMSRQLAIYAEVELHRITERTRGYEAEVVEYLKSGWRRDQLTMLFAAMGATPREAMREKGTPAAELGLADGTASDDAIIDAMLAHPILVNRPIVQTPMGTKLCRPSEVVLTLLDRKPDIFTKEDGEVVKILAEPSPQP